MIFKRFIATQTYNQKEW